MNTETQLNYIIAYLTEKYGEVKPQWWGIIQQIGDNLTMIDECKQSIKENGIYNPKNGKKNPLLSTIKDLQGQILKAYQQLGVTPWSASKIKDDNQTDKDADLLKNIMGD